MGQPQPAEAGGGRTEPLRVALPSTRRRRCPARSALLPAVCEGAAASGGGFPQEALARRAAAGPGGSGGAGVRGRGALRRRRLPPPHGTCEPPRAARQPASQRVRRPPLPAAPGGGSICGSTLRRRLRKLRSQRRPLPRRRGAAEPHPLLPAPGGDRAWARAGRRALKAGGGGG